MILKTRFPISGTKSPAARKVIRKQSHTITTGAKPQAFQWGRARRPKKDTQWSPRIHISAKEDSQAEGQILRVKRTEQAQEQSDRRDLMASVVIQCPATGRTIPTGI